MARKERQLHMQLYPGWSARDNYAQSKKRKRKRNKNEIDNSKKRFLYWLEIGGLCDFKVTTIVKTFKRQKLKPLCLTTFDLWLSHCLWLLKIKLKSTGL